VSTRDEDDLRLVETHPVGDSLWLSAYGQSAWPLIRTTDAFRLRRCEHHEIRSGDLVLVRTEGGELAIRLAVTSRPLQTAAFGSRAEAGPSRVLGRVDRLRRGSLELWLPRALSPILSAAHRVVFATSGLPLARGVTRTARTAWTSGATLPLRRAYLGAMEVRPLGPQDWRALFTFAGRYLRISASFLRQQLQERWADRSAAVGGVARGSLVGFCWVDEYRQEGFDLDGLWIRSLYVRPIARGMGVARKIVERACQAAFSAGAPEVYADVEQSNERSLRVFRSLGFTRVVGALEARLNAEWRMRGRDFQLVVLKKAFFK
jgi:mycothiol synthase